MSAFLSYSQEMRPRVRDEMPGLKNSDVSVVLAQRWRDASETEKRPHQERERWDRQKYYQDLAVWKAAEEERVKEEDQERKRMSARDTIDFMDLPSSLLVWGDSSSGQGSGQDSGSGSPHLGPRGSRQSSSQGSQCSQRSSHHSSGGSAMQCDEDKDNSGGAGVRASKVRKDKNDGNNKRPRPDDIDNISLSTEQWSSMLGTGSSLMPQPSLFQPINAHVIKGAAGAGGHVSATTGPRRSNKPSSSSSSGSNGSMSQKSSGNGSSNGGSVLGGSGSDSGHREMKASPLLGVSNISIHGSTVGARDSHSDFNSEDAQHDGHDRDGTDLGHSPDRTSPDGEGSDCGSEGATDSSSGSSDGADSGLSDRVHRGLSAFVSFMDGSIDSADGSGGSQRARETVDAAKQRRKLNKTKDRKAASVRHRQRKQDSGLAEHCHRPLILTEAHMQARCRAQAALQAPGQGQGQLRQALLSQQGSSPRSFTSQCPTQTLPQQPPLPLPQPYKEQQPFLDVQTAAAGVTGYFCDGGYPFGSNTYGYGGVTRTLFACSSMYNNVPSTALNMPLFAQQAPTIAPQTQLLAPPPPITSNPGSNGNGTSSSSKVRWDTATTYQYPAYYGGMVAPASIAIAAGGDGYGGEGGGDGGGVCSAMTTSENSSRSSSAGSRGNQASR